MVGGCVEESGDREGGFQGSFLGNSDQRERYQRERYYNMNAQESVMFSHKSNDAAVVIYDRPYCTDVAVGHGLVTRLLHSSTP